MFKFQEEADELLEAVIPYLKNFSRISGGEGTVYFIDDNFVVKKYFGDIMASKQNQQTLVDHCAEVNRLSMKGLSIPRIYSVALPMGERKNAYLLEERARGSYIFPVERLEDLLNCYARKKRAKLQDEMFSEFKSRYVTVNEQLEALPDSEIEKFIMTDYYMTRDFKYGTPDVINCNVVFDGNRLMHVDSCFVKEDSSFLDEDDGIEVSEFPAETVMKDMTDLMYHNGFAQESLERVLAGRPGVSKMVNHNRKLVRENIKRFIKKSNSLISPRFEGDHKKQMCEFMTSKISEALNGEEIDDITKLIERE